MEPDKSTDPVRAYLEERVAALTMNLELLTRDREADKERMDKLLCAVETLARVAQIHQDKFNKIEGQNPER
jgi:hypothetical protein